MPDRPIDLQDFPKERFSLLYLTWLSDCESYSGGAAAPSYDMWMDSRSLAGPPSSARYRLGTTVFELRHGATYEIRDADGKRRVFRCLLDDGFPYISFVDQDVGRVYPWITMPGVFSQAEIFSLRELT
ncbi:hypothetical protein [Cupriavidus sp. WS]|uniref:hypothetical protein n=1 Tax=Cupriavidus sp. WS TaxID=1312922 RepID=UPI0012DE66A4|nr:hypothetical protein [Cupriavidus sp. WS]